MMRVILFLCLLCAAAPAFALDVSGTGFNAIPVLHEGRVKPLDSFARALHWRMAGSETPRGQSAPQWLAAILFDPVAAAEKPQFAVHDHNLSAMLGLPARPGNLYSFTEVMDALAPQLPLLAQLAQRTDLTPAQEALLTLHNNVADYLQLMRSLSLLMPLAVTVPESLRPESGTAADYLSLRKYEERAQERLKDIIAKKGEDITAYTDEEKQVAAFSFQLAVIGGAAADNNLLRVIPPQWDGAEWLSPWAVLQQGQGSPTTAALLTAWKDMAAAWDTHDKAAFTAAVAKLRADTPRLKAEILFNKAQPFTIALCLYVLALLLAVAALRWPRARGTAQGALGAGALAHLAGMALRIYILGRPPVGTLYESLLFVALICVAAAWFAGRRHAALLAAGSFAGAALLGLAPLLVRDGDTLPVLVAVLNTNFWLATHVIIITAGYGFSLLCGLAAHVWLAGAAARRPQSIAPAHRLALVALLFTTVGTILGGIWADQSWGRFWGWDPKENGALLIVLWLVWALHGRRAGLLPPALYAVALAGTNIIVALAWFGVNLLSVGLHSYGFTSGIATGLAAFCAAEILLVGGMWWTGRQAQRNKAASHAP